MGDLISARLPTFMQGAPATFEASEWHVAVMKALGPSLAGKVNRCTLERGRITVVAESPAWAARMRFALAEIEPELRQLVPGYRATQVRIRPAGEGRPRR